jgi:hypothetical protein
MPITLEAIEAKQTELADLIAKFKAQPLPLQFPVTITQPHLHDGETYVGTIITPDGSRRHHLILLPGTAASVTWQQAMDFADKKGGVLPDRVESALLYATCKDQFEPEHYWTREPHSDSYAWCQFFGIGSQSNSNLNNELRARAVRRLPI